MKIVYFFLLAHLHIFYQNIIARISIKHYDQPLNIYSGDIVYYQDTPGSIQKFPIDLCILFIAP